MIKKRFISMLVLLAAVATGARAAWTGGTYTATANENLGAITVNGDATLTINSDVTVTVTGGINVASGTLTVTGPGTLVVNGKAGSEGRSNWDEGGTGGTGGNGGVAISGNIIVQGGATVTATGGTGGEGGEGDIGGNGGNGGNAFAGTLTYKGGTVTATGGAGGRGGWGGSGGSAGKAFTTSVNFVSSDYILTDGSNAITATQVTSKNKVVISPKVAVNSVTLAPTSATLTLGETETVTLTATVLPDDATDKTVTWMTSNASVATVANGVVTAVAVGTATITATSNDDATKTATCTVTVSPAGYSVSLKSGTEDATSWQGKAGEGEYQALPLTGLEAGTAVTVKYNGTKKVKSVKAKKKQ